ncbi:MAG: hypothetical protein ACOY5B_17070 [Spirochaetota bacterium]
MKTTTTLKILVAGLTISLLVPACGKKQEGETQKLPAAATGPVGACHYVKEKYCNEYFGGIVTKSWIDENNCKPLKVSVIDKCPTEKAAARCIFDEGTAQMRQMVIYDAKMVKAYCSMAGGKEIPL